MRHRNKKITLGRTAAPRNALLRNLAESLILHGSISTTKAKAKAVKMFLEPLVTKARRGTIADRRFLLRHLSTDRAVKRLIEEIAPRYRNRPGGYLRVVKTGYRPNDSAEKVLISFVET